jgi:hypothetical protein
MKKFYFKNMITTVELIFAVVTDFIYELSL